MAKLTKTQRREIERALTELNRGISYLMDKRVSICRRGNRANTTLDFTRKPPPSDLLDAEQKSLGDYCLTEVTKEIGSNLTGVFEAKRVLERILEAAP